MSPELDAILYIIGCVAFAFIISVFIFLLFPDER